MIHWKRIEPGYYKLLGTPFEIANMRGQSVKWSGLVVNTWEVRDLRRPAGRRILCTVGSMREAKAAVLKEMSR